MEKLKHPIMNRCMVIVGMVILAILVANFCFLPIYGWIWLSDHGHLSSRAAAAGAGVWILILGLAIGMIKEIREKRNET